jgi:hypothetical protein
VTTSHIWTENNNVIASSKDGYIRIFNLSKHAYIPNRHIAGTAVRFSVRQHVTVVHEPIDRKTNPVALDFPLGQKPDTAALQALFTAGPAFVPLDPSLTPIARFGDFIPPVAAHRDDLSLHPGSPQSSQARSQQQQNLPPFKHDHHHDERFGFDPTVFQYLAENYIYHGDRATTLCEHNANVATQAQSPQLAQMWRMLALIFTPSEDFMANSGHLSASGKPNVDGFDLKVHVGEKTIIDKPGLDLSSLGVGDPSAAIPIEFSGANSDAAPSPAGGTGTRSVEMFSPLPDDWDLHLLDVPYAQQHAGIFQTAGSGAGVGLQARSDHHRPSLSLDFGAFDHQHQSGFTDHDFVEEFEHPRSGGGSGMGLGIGGGALLDSDGLTPHRSNGDGFPGHAFGSAFAAVQAASVLENQQEWEATSVVHEILNFHENTGDVQTCVFVGLVLQDVITIEPRKMLAWMIAYVELLHRLQLWNCANSLAKHCHLDSIRNMSKQGTTIYTKCASCNKAILGNSGVYCENCKKPTSNCALCRLPVKGSLVWCPGCGHGGHSHHMAEWFATETHCPTGCGHICLFTPPSSNASSATPMSLSVSGSRSASPAVTR